MISNYKIRILKYCTNIYIKLLEEDLSALVSRSQPSFCISAGEKYYIPDGNHGSLGNEVGSACSMKTLTKWF